MAEKYVTIHGGSWKYQDIESEVLWAKKQKWEKRKWVPRAALISKSKVSEYRGQKFDPEYTELVEDGWSHDHCEICCFTIFESDNPEEGEGYTTDGSTWVCTECYEQFLQRKA